MRALWGELERRGLRIEGNRVARGTPACLFNSFNFDFRKFRRALRHSDCRRVHRVDGPIGVYRGFDDGTDARIHEINREIADATVFQSHYSLAKHRELGMDFAEPHVIPNAVDPHVFHATGRTAFSPGRRVRLVSVSWSDNPNKGAAVYRWLDRNLDWTRYEYRFLGRVKEPFARIEQVGALPSVEVATLLRDSDIYVTASKDDPCSNSLLEALSCGLPCLYLDSGGHPEIAGQAGLAFNDATEIPGLLDRLLRSYNDYQAAISLPTIADVAGQYMDVLCLPIDRHAGLTR